MVEGELAHAVVHFLEEAVMGVIYSHESHDRLRDKIEGMQMAEGDHILLNYNIKIVFGDIKMLDGQLKRTIDSRDRLRFSVEKGKEGE